MGSCVSSTTKHPETADKFILNNNIVSLSDKLVMPSPINADRPIIRELSHNSYPSRNFGSKEENFFDSQAWLDSDCDDDFLSVNGELTPSRGDTPAHHSFAPGVPRVNKVLLEDSDPGGGPESSPPDKKTRLSDLFKDSLQELDEHCISGNVSEMSHASGVDSTERTPNRKKSTKSVQCCLPSLRRPSRNFSHRKKMSPYDNIG